MSDISVRCPNCNTKYRLSSELAGKKLKCKSCENSFRVNGDDSPASDSPKKKQKKAAPVDEWDTGDNLDGDSGPLQAYTPRKRVKKKSGASEIPDKPQKRERPVENISKGLLFAMLGVGLVVVLAAVGIVFYFGTGLLNIGSGGSGLVINDQWVKYNGQGSFLRFDHPVDWQGEHSGGSGGLPAVVRISFQGVKLEARDNMADNAKGDMMRLGGGSREPGEVPIPEEQPVHKMHLSKLSEIQALEPGYEETQPEIIKTGLGEARVSKFKRPGGLFSGDLVGYRCTLPPGIRSFTIFCECSESQFEQLAPVFRRMLESTTLGSGQ